MKDIHETISNLFKEIDELKETLDFCLQPLVPVPDSSSEPSSDNLRSGLFGAIVDETARLVVLCDQIQTLRQRVDLPSQP